MRIWPRRWHPETWICSIRGHAAPGVAAAHVGPGDRWLVLELPDRCRLARCLRCDMWVEHQPRSDADATWPSLPALADLPKPRRGKPLREAILIRLIALERAAHCVAFSMLAVAFGLLDTNLDRVHEAAQSVIRGLEDPSQQSGPGAAKSRLDQEMTDLLDLQPATLRLLCITAAVYAAVEGAEAVGLWLERRWAEFLTAVATAGFLPFEIHELTEQVSALRVVTMAANVAVLAWLLWNKRLFGLRGGPAGASAGIDWEEVVAHPTPAPLDGGLVELASSAPAAKLGHRP